MKNNLFTISCLTVMNIFLIILQLNAQRVFSVGPSIGIGVASQTFAGESHYTAAFNSGIQFSIPLNEKITLNPDLKFATKGYRDISFSWFEYSGTTLSLLYLSCGVPAKGFLSPVFFLEGGLQVGYLLKGSSENVYGEFSDKDNTMTEYLKRIDFGALAGFGFQFKNGIEVALIVNPGFVDIDSEKPDPYYNKPYGKNFVGIVELSYLIKTHKK